MGAKLKMNWFFVAAILLIASICIVESKRGFSIGRSRKKTQNPSVRRKSQAETYVAPSAPDHSASNQKPIGWNVGNNAAPVGPPPAYPGLGHNVAPAHGLPPAYSPSLLNPPSYSAGTGYPFSNIGKIPPRGHTHQSGFPDTTSFNGIGYGNNVYGGPSYTSGTYGSGFGYSGGLGSSPFSFGNILTGLAVWNIARGFNSHNRPQHVYIHDNKGVSNEGPMEPTIDVVRNSTQISHENIGTVVSTSACETCDELPISALSTESPAVEANFVTYHPSLMTYASQIGYHPSSFHYFRAETTTDIVNDSETTTDYNMDHTSTEFPMETSTETER